MRILVPLNSIFPSLRQGMLDFGSKHFCQVENTIHFRPKKMSEPSVMARPNQSLSNVERSCGWLRANLPGKMPDKYLCKTLEKYYANRYTRSITTLYLVPQTQDNEVVLISQRIA